MCIGRNVNRPQRSLGYTNACHPSSFVTSTAYTAWVVWGRDSGCMQLLLLLKLPLMNPVIFQCIHLSSFVLNKLHLYGDIAGDREGILFVCLFVLFVGRGTVFLVSGHSKQTNYQVQEMQPVIWQSISDVFVCSSKTQLRLKGVQMMAFSRYRKIWFLEGLCDVGRIYSKPVLARCRLGIERLGNGLDNGWVMICYERDFSGL